MDAAAWDDRYRVAEYIWTDRANMFVERHAADHPPGRAIDLACGEGRNAVWLAANGWEVTAVDFSTVALEKALRLATDHDITINRVEADATRWAPDQPVDLVVIAYLQITDPERTAVLRQAAEWLVPGGTLLIVAHDRTNHADGYGGPPDPAVCYDLDETVEALSSLTIEHAAVEQRPVVTADGTRHALDTVVVARRPAASCRRRAGFS
ncbi:MAG: class I SAM-dependent methyltransferase [Actinomycetota bacterium]